MAGQWRTQARRIIDRVAEEWLEARRMDRTDLGAAERKALLKHVSGAYPWGEREAYPYTAWLLEMRAFREWLEGAGAGPAELPALGGLFAEVTG